MTERPEAHLAMSRATQDVLRLIPRSEGCMVVLVVGAELVEASRAGSLGGPEQIRLSITESLAGLSFISGETFRCDDAETNPHVDHATAGRFGITSLISVPLRNGVRAMGAIVAASRDRAAFSETDVETLIGIARSLETQIAPPTQRRFASSYITKA